MFISSVFSAWKKTKQKKTKKHVHSHFSAGSFTVCHKTLISEQHCKQNKAEGQTNKSTENYIPLSPSTAAKLGEDLERCLPLLLLPPLPHRRDFRSNLSGACQSISLSTLSITVQHYQGNGVRWGQTIPSTRQSFLSLAHKQAWQKGGGWRPADPRGPQSIWLLCCPPPPSQSKA